uniref:Uncharacterized protein n=1 Tax=Arundo donax TaxID=35708 RepID=A0A0A9AY76_ARUDO
MVSTEEILLERPRAPGPAPRSASIRFFRSISSIARRHQYMAKFGAVCFFNSSVCSGLMV